MQLDRHRTDLMQKIEPPPQGPPMSPPSPRFFFSFSFSRKGVLFFAYDDPQKSKKSGGWGRHWKSLWGGLYFLHKTGITVVDNVIVFFQVRGTIFPDSRDSSDEEPRDYVCSSCVFPGLRA